MEALEGVFDDIRMEISIEQEQEQLRINQILAMIALASQFLSVASVMRKRVYDTTCFRLSCLQCLGINSPRRPYCA
jgi:hypothetical protein